MADRRAAVAAVGLAFLVYLNLILREKSEVLSPPPKLSFVPDKSAQTLIVR